MTREVLSTDPRVEPADLASGSGPRIGFVANLQLPAGGPVS